MPLPLKWLTLHPVPLIEFPEAGSEASTSFAAELKEEAEALLALSDWTQPKDWHGGLVSTRSLPAHAISDASAQKGKKPEQEHKSFWGGGKKGQDHDPFAGIHWHARDSYHAIEEAEHGYGFEAYWEALGTSPEAHVTKEKGFVKTLDKTFSLNESKDAWLKLYNLPMGTANRSFAGFISVISSTPASANAQPTFESLRSFLVISVPVDVPEQKADKGYVRGQYVSVEKVEEVLLAGGKKAIRWRCASASTPGGSIPTRLAQSHMASSMAADIPSFFSWLAREHKRPPGSVPATPKAATHSPTLDGPLSSGLIRKVSTGLGSITSFRTARTSLDGVEAR